MPRIRSLKPQFWDSPDTQLIHSGPIPADLQIPGGEPAWNRQFVYHLHHASGELLYVGRTAVLGRRFRQHRRQKPWWTTVAIARIYLIEAKTRAEAISAAAGLESTAIHAILPAANLMGPANLPAKAGRVRIDG